MSLATPADARVHRVVRLIYPLRIAGCLFTLAILLAVWRGQPWTPAMWVGVIAHTLLWPHLAYLLARRGGDPKRAETRNLMVDSAAIGAWDALMGFALLPTLALTVAMWMNLLNVGGLRLALRGLLATAAAAASVAAWNGFAVQWHVSLFAEGVCVALILVFISAVGMNSFLTNRRMVQARRAAEAANRAKSEFLAKMSHEIRTPMNAIVGFADLALRSESTDRLRESMTHVDSAARSLMKIINDILDLSKIEAGKLVLEEREFAVRPLIEKVAGLIRPQADAKFLRLRVDIAPEVPAVLVGDSLRIEQILMNLAGNAVKFTEAGEVAVALRSSDRDAQRARVEFEVCDTGIGIAAEQLPRLFAPFIQADDSTTRLYGGTGLGLAISRQLAELMQGTLRADSTPGRGSRFVLSLDLRIGTGPADAAPAAPRRSVQQLSGESQLRGKRVLLVEDNALNRRLAGVILEEAGIRVDVAMNGEEAVHHVRQQTYDAVLMDVQMPVMDGLSATRAIRELPGCTHVPIIAMTANALAQDREACRAAGMDDFLAKPIDAQQVLDMLAKWSATMPDRVGR